MDKSAIKKFAINARQKLIGEVMIKANQLGIFPERIDHPIEIEKSLHEFTSGLRIGQKAIDQRQKLVAEIKQRSKGTTHQEAFESVMEEVAYTWFNRLIAIRFMEVNHYLPEDIRVLSSEQANKTEPDIVTELLETDLAESFTSQERQQIVDWKLEGSSESMDALYQFTFIKVCNDLNQYLPELFEKIDDYTELLFAASFINQDGVIKDLRALSESNFDVSQGGQVEIIGWLYQYYNTEPKDEVFSRPKTKKIEKNDIPAATQLFTPHWIVKYMVENSLGRFYIDKLLGTANESRNEAEIAKSFGWEYYLPTAEQIEAVQLELKDSQKQKSNYTIDDIKFIDPSMGSGHILIYAFEVFMQLYENEGYSSREAASLIIDNNLFGLDIDERARQLAYFAVMMKAREYDRLALRKNLKPNVFDVEETGNLKDEVVVQNFTSTLNSKELRESLRIILDKFECGKTLGSLIQLPSNLLYDELLNTLSTYQEGQDIFVSINALELEKLRRIIQTAKLLSSSYEVVVTNPPYMGSSGMNKYLGDYVKKAYPNSKSDLFAVFIEKCIELISSKGYVGMITQHAWMFLSSYENLRREINKSSIVNMAHLGARAFEEIGGEVVQTTSFIIEKNINKSYKANYIRLTSGNTQTKKESMYLNVLRESGMEMIFRESQETFSKIPGAPIAYWASATLIESFKKYPRIEFGFDTREGMTTANNDLFMRNWHEVIFTKIGLYQTEFNENKWYPYNKGGKYRKWYGNDDYIVNWEENGKAIKSNIDERTGRVRSHNYNGDYALKEAVTWSAISSGDFSSRYSEVGSMFDSKGVSGFSKNNVNLKFIMGLLNSKVSKKFLKILSSTMDYKIGHILSVPLKIDNISVVISEVEKLILIYKDDWDTFENSWNFNKHPLIFKNEQLIEQTFQIWKIKSIENYKKAIQYEENLNQLFINSYGLDNELTPEVLEKEITIRKADLPRDIKSFISYAVGVMFGRYSLDEEGLIYAGGEWDSSKYSTFIPDKDNLLIISEDEYFTDSSLDIVNRFVEFVEVVYSPETLEENLEFIAEALGGKGDSRKVIRNYFLKHFYKDHVQVYSKRPIYWQFDSGKQNGFKALMYLHRYDQDTLGKVRTDYLHELQKAYDGRLELRKQQIESSDSPKEKAVWQKEIEKLEKQRKEARDYDEKLGHLALKRISLDLDDGVIVNYDKLQRDSETNTKYQILSKGPAEPKK